MNNLKVGDIVLVEFPFSDLQEIKLRPALILLELEYESFLVAFITSKIPKNLKPYELLLKRETNEYLLADSVVNVGRLTTLSKSLIKRKLGSLSIQQREQVKKCLDFWTALI
jgi:mRNA interferase MazF